MEGVGEREADAVDLLRAALVEPGHLADVRALARRASFFSSTWQTISRVGERLRELDGVADVVAVAVRDAITSTRSGVFSELRRLRVRRSGTGRCRSACRGRSRAGTRAWPSQVSVAICSFRSGIALSIEGPSGPRREAMRPWDVECFRLCSSILAAYADSRGSHGLAFDALLVAVPFAAVAALERVRRATSSVARTRSRRCRRSLWALVARAARALVRRAHAGAARDAAAARRRRRSSPASASSRSRSRVAAGAVRAPARGPAARQAVATGRGSERQRRSRPTAATSISGCTTKNEPTVTTSAERDAGRRAASSRGGEPPAGASCSSALSRRYIARTTPR